MYLVVSLFGFEGRIWDPIVSVPDHCLSFYFRSKFETLRREIKADVRKQHDLYVNNLVGDVKANPRDFYRYINS